MATLHGRTFCDVTSVTTPFYKIDESLGSKEYKNLSPVEPHPLGEELAWA